MFHGVVSLPSTPEQLGRTGWLNQWTTTPVVPRDQRVADLQSLSGGTRSPYLENPQSWVLHREESLVCTMDAVYVAGIASLFTIPIPAGQLTWGHRDHHMVIFFLEECWRAEAVHQHCWWRLPRWFLKCFVVSEFEAGSDTEPGGLYMAWLNPVPFKQNCSSNNRLFSWGLLMVFLCNLTLIC